MRINIPVTSEIEAYIDEVGFRESTAQAACRAEAALRGELAVLQMPPEQGALLHLLVELIDARLVLELGTFTGYSALAIAQALPADGHLITCDNDFEVVDFARRFWKQADVESKIDVRLGDATETLRGLLAEGFSEKFDLILIDADKPGYPTYFDLSSQLLRRGGLIVIDDTLAHGRVATGPMPSDPAFVAPAVEAIRAVNARLVADTRFTSVLLPTRDGLTLARKR